jgi:hypothetical protein
VFHNFVFGFILRQMNETTEEHQSQVAPDVITLEDDAVKTGESCPADTEFQGKAKMCEGENT